MMFKKLSMLLSLLVLASLILAACGLAASPLGDPLPTLVTPSSTDDALVVTTPTLEPLSVSEDLYSSAYIGGNCVPLSSAELNGLEPPYFGVCFDITMNQDGSVSISYEVVNMASSAGWLIGKWSVDLIDGFGAAKSTHRVLYQDEMYTGGVVFDRTLIESAVDFNDTSDLQFVLSIDGDVCATNVPSIHVSNPLFCKPPSELPLAIYPTWTPDPSILGHPATLTPSAIP